MKRKVFQRMITTLVEVLILKVETVAWLNIDVAGVINYSMPASVANYVHRIGRTARADHLGVDHGIWLFLGTALSFIVPTSETDRRILVEIQKYNPPRDGHPVPQRLPFDISQVESFNYR